MNTALKFTRALDSDGEPYPGDYEAITADGTYRVRSYIGYHNRITGYTITFVAADGASCEHIGSKEFHGICPRGERTLAIAKATVRAHYEASK